MSIILDFAIFQFYCSTYRNTIKFEIGYVQAHNYQNDYFIVINKKPLSQQHCVIYFLIFIAYIATTCCKTTLLLLSSSSHSEKKSIKVFILSLMLLLDEFWESSCKTCKQGTTYFVSQSETNTNSKSSEE